MTASAPFRILSLAGGGIQGTFTAAVLAAWEGDTGLRVSEHFDPTTGKPGLRRACPVMPSLACHDAR